MFVISSTKNNIFISYFAAFLVFFGMEFLEIYLETHLKHPQNTRRPSLFWSVFNTGEFRYSRTITNSPLVA